MSRSQGRAALEVAMVTYGMRGGGMERAILTLGAGLKNRGHHVTVCFYQSIHTANG